MTLFIRTLTLTPCIYSTPTATQAGPPACGSHLNQVRIEDHCLLGYVDGWPTSVYTLGMTCTNEAVCICLLYTIQCTNHACDFANPLARRPHGLWAPPYPCSML